MLIGMTRQNSPPVLGIDVGRVIIGAADSTGERDGTRTPTWVCRTVVWADARKAILNDLGRRSAGIALARGS